jgi:hypothetical protein
MAKQDRRPTSITLDHAVAERLSSECHSVSAYVRALIDADTWRLERALERLRKAEVGADEARVLADHGVEGSSIVDAARVVAEVERLGRRVTW